MYYPFTFSHILSCRYELEYYNSYCSYSWYSPAIVVVVAVVTVVDFRIFSRDNMVNDNDNNSL